MLAKVRDRLTYANVVSSVCLFVLLGGTSYAVATGSIDSREIRNNSVRSKDIKNNDIRGADVRNFSLLAKDFKRGQFPEGERGPQGGQGPQGPPGQDATKLWAVVDSAGNLLRGSGAVSSAAASGGYEVIFNRDVTACAYQATLGSAQAEVGQVGVGPRNGKPDGVFVYTSNSVGAAEAHGFNVAVFC